MKDIITWSIRDEMMHCDGMTKLFREYVKENLDIWNDYHQEPYILRCGKDGRT
jgi:ribonucleotide reductase beta subunit family protein with ferritin-like domain